jgi:hypothetical protein
MSNLSNHAITFFGYIPDFEGVLTLPGLPLTAEDGAVVTWDATLGTWVAEPVSSNLSVPGSPGEVIFHSITDPNKLGTSPHLTFNETQGLSVNNAIVSQALTVPKVTGLLAPTDVSDAVNKAYLDAVIAALTTEIASLRTDLDAERAKRQEMEVRLTLQDTWRLSVDNNTDRLSFDFSNDIGKTWKKVVEFDPY